MHEDATLQADVLVIGFGKGGKTLATTLGARGQRVVLVEQSALMYGGHLHQHRVHPHQIDGLSR